MLKFKLLKWVGGLSFKIHIFEGEVESARSKGDEICGSCLSWHCDLKVLVTYSTNGNQRKITQLPSELQKLTLVSGLGLLKTSKPLPLTHEERRRHSSLAPSRVIALY